MNNHTCFYCGSPVKQAYKGTCPRCPKDQPLIRSESYNVNVMVKDQQILLKKVRNCADALNDVHYDLTKCAVNMKDLRITNKIADRIQSFITDMDDIISFSKK